MSDVAFDISRCAKISFGDVSRSINCVEETVRRTGEAILTRNQQASLVLLTVGRFVAIQRRVAVDTRGIEAEFDVMFGKMQEPGAAERMRQALRIGSKRMGDNAHAAAKSIRR